MAKDGNRLPPHIRQLFDEIESFYQEEVPKEATEELNREAKFLRLYLLTLEIKKLTSALTNEWQKYLWSDMKRK